MSAEDDIDRFIQEQKQKIARERQDLQHINGKIPAPVTNGYRGVTSKENFPPRAPGNQNKAVNQSDDAGLPVGRYQNTKEQLQRERQEEYKKYIKEKNNRSSTRKTNVEGDGMSLPIGERLSAQEKSRVQRNKEYNEFLKQKGGGRRSGQKDAGSTVPNGSGPPNGYGQQPPTNGYAQPQQQQPTNGYGQYPPGGNDPYGASRPQREAASQTPLPPRGYDDPPPRGPRKGWGTPQPVDYDDLLRRKREEESRYRGYDDTDYYQPRLKPARSDPYLNRYADDGRRSARPEYYDDYDRRRVRFIDEVPPPAARDGPPYSDRSARPRQRESFEEPIVYDWNRSKAGRSRTFTDGERPKPALKQDDPARPPRAKSASLAEESGLPLGQRDTGSATRRKKEQYRRELEQQMEEAKAAKQREKAIDRSPGFPGSSKQDVAPTGRQSRNQGQPGLQQQQQQPPQGYTPSFQQQPYRTQPASVTPYPGGQYDSRQQQGPSYGGASTPFSQPIGDLGLQAALAKSQPEQLDRPFSLNYPVPSSLNQPNTNTDPYMYYGVRNLLEPDPTPSAVHGLPHPTAAAGSSIVPPLSNLNSPLMERYLLLQQQQQQLLQQQQQLEQQFSSSAGSNQLNQQLNNSTVTKQAAAQFRGESSIKNFVGDNNLSPRSQANAPSYREQLLLQMKENEAKKNAELSAKAAYEAKLDKQVEVYDPWGKGGAGAPMRDKQGKIVADLKQLHNRNETILNDSNRKDLQLYAGAGNAPPTNPAVALAPGQEVSPLLAAAAAAGGGGSPSAVAAPGGAGPAYGRIKGSITGAAPDPVADASRNEYQDQLRLQVEEKKRRELEEKEKIRLEEEKEEKRLAAQRERIQREYEKEIERKKQKEEAQRKQKEDLERQLEEKRKEADAKKKEVNEKRRREAEDKLRHRDLNHNVSNLNQPRGASPPIPALRTKEPELPRVLSPPIPALQKKDRDTARQPPPEPVRRSTQSPPIPALQKKEKKVVNPEEKSKTRPAPIRRKEKPRRDDDFPSISERSSARSASPPVPAVSTKERGGPKEDTNVMGALSAMRVQLAYEQQRIQSQLDKHRDYDPYNPQPKAVHAPRRGSPQVDVFELARHKGSVAVLRNATHQAAEDFDGLKNRNNMNIQNEFKSPELTAQKPQRRKATTNDIPSLRDIGRGSPAVPLDSDSAFIGIDSGETHMPKSASRPTRSNAVPSPVDSQPRKKTGRSVSRLDNDDLDKIIAKSQARSDAIETLHDHDSDPDDILNKFLSKKSFDSRPPSGKSEDLSLWLKPSFGQT